MKELADRSDRARIRSDLDVNLVVEAAAGTGKTTELVNRIIAVLAQGRTTVDRLVAVTFTEKAAGELKLRMRSELERARQAAAAPAERIRLEGALARLEEARVGTIHGFCADLLRERSVEAQVDPRFQTMTEPEAERLFRETFHLWLQEKLEDPTEGVRRSLRRRSRPGRPHPGGESEGGEGPIGKLRKAGWTLAAWRDFRAGWRRDPFEREPQIDAVILRLTEFAALTRSCSKPSGDLLQQDTEPARRLAELIATADHVRARDYDGLEAQLVALHADRNFRKPRKGYGTTYGPGVSREGVLAKHAELCAALESFALAADADLAALLQPELFEVVDRYEARKQSEGRLDFVDLLARARDLIRDCRGVREDFQRRFTHIFVDEFQDTDPLQAEILLLLAADDPSAVDWREVRPAPGKLFVVADPKQSIYRFRRADVGTYLAVREQLTRGGAAFLQLTTSFRSVPEIQNAINAAFSKHMTGDHAVHQSEYVPLSGAREDVPGQPAVVALPVPEPYGYRGVTKTAIESSLPGAVGAFVEWLLGSSGWTVTERENPGVRVPVRARHVCLLFRRLDSFFAGDVTRGYVSALEARGIRHLLVGGRSFHDREEVETIRTAMTALEWPEDELSVFATLRGSLFAIGDEELLEYRHRYGRLRLFPIPTREDLPENLAPIGEALRRLASLHRGRNRRPIAETIRSLLEATRAHAGFVLRPSGEQALANVLHVAEQARAYESTGGISFRGFVERLLEDAGGARSAEAPILEEGSDGVRIMTVHKAKGLEFPVVILCDITASIALPQASRAIDAERNLCALRIGDWSPVELIEGQERELGRDHAEGIRLAYVAATRARDLLVVPAVGDGPMEGVWTSPLDGAIYPPRALWNKPSPAPGCPKFGRESVLARPDNGAGGVCPGRHAFPGAPAVPGAAADPAASGGYGVVWWDPSILSLDAAAPGGLRNEELISKDAAPEAVDADLLRYKTWQASRAAALEAASQPSLFVRTATQLASAPASASGSSRPGSPGSSALAPPAVPLIQLPVDRNRPAGPRFGALVHASLATVSLAAAGEEIVRAVELQARILGASAEESCAASSVVEAALHHELMVRARRAAARGQCRRETPITLRQSDGSLIEGVVDLAFLEDLEDEDRGTGADGWIVLDFKTDQEVVRELPRYRAQVALYAEAIAAATGRTARGIILAI